MRSHYYRRRLVNNFALLLVQSLRRPNHLIARDFRNALADKKSMESAPSWAGRDALYRLLFVLGRKMKRSNLKHEGTSLLKAATTLASRTTHGVCRAVNVTGTAASVVTGGVFKLAGAAVLDVVGKHEESSEPAFPWCVSLYCSLFLSPAPSWRRRRGYCSLQQCKEMRFGLRETFIFL